MLRLSAHIRLEIKRHWLGEPFHFSGFLGRSVGGSLFWRREWMGWMLTYAKPVKSAAKWTHCPDFVAIGPAFCTSKTLHGDLGDIRRFARVKIVDCGALSVENEGKKTQE